MKLHIAQTASNLVTSYGEGYVTVLRDRYEQSVVVFPDSVIPDWAPQSFENLRAEDFAPVLAGNPEIVLLGTGEKQRFPRPEVLRPLIESGRGFEVMDTAAACRTYNILVAEGRRVAAAILMR